MEIKKTLQELIGSGMTQAEIGREVNRDQSTISDMLNHDIGLKNPSYDFVSRLQALYERRLQLNDSKQTHKPV